MCLPLISARIVDYSDAYFIAVEDGDVATYVDHDYLIHRTNLTEYELTIRENERLLENFTDSREIGMIREQIGEINRLLGTLRMNRRHARSLDFLGSALKFVAGTPDHSDMELLTTREAALARNNDRQMTINSALRDKINDLTNRINFIQDRGSSNAIGEDKFILFQLIISRNGEIISFLNGLALSIILAKENIANPVIFDDMEIKRTLELRKIPVSINSVLRSSNVSVFQDENIIYYIVKFPVLTNFCKFLKIYPVIHNNSVIKLEFIQASKCNDYTFPITDCTNIASPRICRETEQACLSQLLNNNTASCKTQSADHIPTVERVSEGSILLNNVQNTNITEGETVKVNGTLLIIFTGNITVNGTSYCNNDIGKRKVVEAHPPKTINFTKTGHEVKLTLPYLNKINLEAYELISDMEEHLIAHKAVIISLTIAIPILVWLIYHLHGNKKTNLADMENIIQQIRSKQGRSDI